MTTIINIKKKYLNERGISNIDEWLSKQDTLYIGRNMSFYPVFKNLTKSKWNNPFSVKKYGRDECLKMYENYIKESPLYDRLHELKNKELGCWCKPEGCHGDILIKLYNEKYNE